MTKNHNYYLDLAYQIAEKNLGKTGLNPSVGAIVVKDNSVISSGITSYRGRPHAEFNALSKIKNCSGASLYTSLEPCVRITVASSRLRRLLAMCCHKSALKHDAPLCPDSL